jgi:TM2 domain-containing membrane protein YozV
MSAETLKPQRRDQIMKINKHVYTWVGTFLFGILGVNRFMRIQFGLGLLKLITFGLCGVWFLIDLIIALSKLSQYEKNFVFDDDGYWSNRYSKDGEETTKRLIEAAKKGIDSKAVVGYRVIEKIEGLRTCMFYDMFKDICMELLKHEYLITEVTAWRDKNKYDAAWLDIYKNVNEDSYENGGMIKFFGNVTGFGKEAINDDYSRNHGYYSGKWKHSIQIFPFLLIDSKVPYTKEPPELLMICANVIKKYNFTFTEPPWIQEKPDARKYVNVMFK